MNYLDITEEILSQDKKKYKIVKQKFYIDKTGKKYIIDGKYIILKLTKREIEVANILGCIYGGKIRLIPKVNKPDGIKTPDYIIGEQKFDLKEITGGGKYVIEGNLRKKQKQANNFIIDITNAKLSYTEADKQINSIYISKRYKWIDKIILIKSQEIIKAYKRK